MKLVYNSSKNITANTSSTATAAKYIFYLIKINIKYIHHQFAFCYCNYFSLFSFSFLR